MQARNRALSTTGTLLDLDLRFSVSAKGGNINICCLSQPVSDFIITVNITTANKTKAND
jgi:hypothetical protein